MNPLIYKNAYSHNFRSAFSRQIYGWTVRRRQVEHSLAWIAGLFSPTPPPASSGLRLCRWCLWRVLETLGGNHLPALLDSRRSVLDLAFSQLRWGWPSAAASWDVGSTSFVLPAATTSCSEFLSPIWVSRGRIGNIVQETSARSLLSPWYPVQPINNTKHK